MNDRLFISALRLLPKNALSRAAGALTRWRAPAPLRIAAMKAFARPYGIDLSECPEVEVYRTFGEFFARPLRPGLRPVAPGDAVPAPPVDGAVSEAGLAEGGRLVLITNEAVDSILDLTRLAGIFSIAGNAQEAAQMLGDSPEADTA